MKTSRWTESLTNIALLAYVTLATAGFPFAFLTAILAPRYTLAVWVVVAALLFALFRWIGGGIAMGIAAIDAGTDRA